MEYSEPDDDRFEISVTTWVAETGGETTNSCYARVFGWDDNRGGLWYYARKIIVRDGLVSLQVTVHKNSCFGCRLRVELIKKLIADQNIQCFWTREPNDGSLYVTVGPLPPGMPPSKYLTSVFSAHGSTRGLMVLDPGSFKTSPPQPAVTTAPARNPKAKP
jgi:hypothetical protein